MGIRLIDEKDIPVVRALTAEIAQHERFENFDVPESYFAENFLGDGRYSDIYVIEVDGKVIGMGHVIKMASTYIGGHELYLRDFVITKEYRNQGYGAQFIKFLRELAQKRNCKKVCWYVYNWNDEALGLYKKFSQIGDDLNSCTIDEIGIQKVIGK